MKRIRDTSCIAVDLAIKVLDGIGSAKANEASSRLKTRDFVGYLGMRVDHHSYTDASSFRDDYLAVELMSKFPNFDTGIDREKVAIEGFLLAEEKCRIASENLQFLRRGRFSINHPAHTILHSARLKIRKALGPFDWNQASRFFSFGPGASIGIPRASSDGPSKYGCLKPSVTQACSALAAAAIFRNQGWLSHLSLSGLDPFSALSVVEGNRVTTVPKNAKTDRIIAIEPLMNMYIQKGIGALIRRRLRHVGVNLDSQLLNQQLAAEGSVTGCLATVDLSMASDSISLALVDDLLPVDWVEAIKACRSPVGVLPDGRKIRYRKVSSMGNGFTFELESLIFWALTKSVVDHIGDLDRRLAIYGDDIVVDTRAVPLLAEIFSFVGFTFNERKSFSTGDFRESCGKHYFRGTDVTPFYLRKDVAGDERLIWAANTIRAYSVYSGGYGCDRRFHEAHSMCIKHMSPVSRRLRGPLWLEGQLSTAWVGADFDESTPRRASFGHDSFSVRGLLRVYKQIRKDGLPSFTRWLDLSDRPARRLCNHNILRNIGLYGGVSNTDFPSQRYKLRIVKFSVRQWADTGPWI